MKLGSDKSDLLRYLSLVLEHLQTRRATIRAAILEMALAYLITMKLTCSWLFL